MHYGTFRLGRKPMDEPLPRLLRAAMRAGVQEQVMALDEGESWMEPKVVEREGPVSATGGQAFPS